jgi:hypothetical protein
MYNCKNTQHNSYFICTSAKFYVGIVHRFSTSAKEKAQLQNTWHNCKTNCTTAKKMHNGDLPLPSKKIEAGGTTPPHDRNPYISIYHSSQDGLPALWLDGMSS